MGQKHARDIAVSMIETVLGWTVACVDAGDTNVYVRQDPAGEGLLIEICTETDAEASTLTLTLDGTLLDQEAAGSGYEGQAHRASQRYNPAHFHPGHTSNTYRSHNQADILRTGHGSGPITGRDPISGPGARPADLDTVAGAIAGVSELAVEFGEHIEALNVSPPISRPDGAVAVDALAVPLRMTLPVS